MRPLGAKSVAGVGMDLGRSGSSEMASVLGAHSRFFADSSSILDAIRATPKYSPDLLAEKIKYTFSEFYGTSKQWVKNEDEG